jgi:prophage regulatory protein
MEVWMGTQRVVSYSSLEHEYGISYSRVHLARLEAAGNFPRRVHIGENRIGWIADEIEGFLRSRAEAREASTKPALIGSAKNQSLGQEPQTALINNPPQSGTLRAHKSTVPDSPAGLKSHASPGRR